MSSSPNDRRRRNNNKFRGASDTFTILIERKDLYDASSVEESTTTDISRSSNDTEDPVGGEATAASTTRQDATMTMIRPYAYDPSVPPGPTRFAFVNIPTCASTPLHRPSIAVDRDIPNPLPESFAKYWNQRRRLFSKFDQGILLDQEGWFSVTPEQIASHVAQQVAKSYCDDTDAPFVVLDAFGGCGGNAIAFAKRPEVTKVICVDLDRQKLRATAHNANIYGIPKEKMILVECNVIFLLQFCYRHGNFILDAPLENEADAIAMMEAMPPAAPMEHCAGFSIGGIDLLPRDIHLIFMDPPWGGVDYNAFGRHGYSLQDHMRIPRLHSHLKEKKAAESFFDSFEPTNQEERKAAFNCALDETNCVNGAELLSLAATASRDASVVYDIPRNTNRSSLAEAALAAGYRGNCKLDEHHLNGRLKTVTAYLGKDWRTSGE